MDNLNDKEKIILIIEEIKPFIISDGGDIEIIKYENNILYIKLTGACQNCEMIDITLKDIIEENIKEEVPNLKEIKIYDEN